jgi:hypothetical protein
MVIFTVIVISMAILSAIFWWVEAQPWVNALKAIKSRSVFDKILYPVAFIKVLPLGIPLFVDIIATGLLAYTFGLNGVIGGAMGLSMSNVISVGILWNIYRKNKDEVEYA